MGLFLLAFLSAGADPEPRITPEGPPPTLVFLTVSAGKVVRPVLGTVVREEEKEVVRVVGGRVVRELVPITRGGPGLVERPWPMEGATFGLAGGGRIDAAAFKQRLGEGAAVIVSADGRPVHPGYLKAFKPSTLVLIPAP